MKTIKILYFDKKSIFTIDLVFLFKTLLDIFPNSDINLVEMNEEFKFLCSEQHAFGITSIKKRLMIFEDNIRREDLENLVIQRGTK